LTETCECVDGDIAAAAAVTIETVTIAASIVVVVSGKGVAVVVTEEELGDHVGTIHEITTEAVGVVRLAAAAEITSVTSVERVVYFDKDGQLFVAEIVETTVTTIPKVTGKILAALGATVHEITKHIKNIFIARLERVLVT